MRCVGKVWGSSATEDFMLETFSVLLENTLVPRLQSKPVAALGVSGSSCV